MSLLMWLVLGVVVLAWVVTAVTGVITSVRVGRLVARVDRMTVAVERAEGAAASAKTSSDVVAGWMRSIEKKAKELADQEARSHRHPSFSGHG